jgi:hypothetical protein
LLSLAAATAGASLPEDAVADDVRAARTKAVEIRVEAVERVASIGHRKARPGYELVVVDTSWKNLIPLTPVDKKAAAAGSNPVGGLTGFGSRKPASGPADITMEPTPYVVPELANHLWLLSDERFADPVDPTAQGLAPDHLSKKGFTVPDPDTIVRGKLVFEAPAGATYQALRFFDKTHGHAIVTIAGAPLPPPARTGGVQENDLLRASLTAAHPLENGQAPEGSRRYALTVRGRSLRPNDLAAIPMAYVYAQTDRGCLASPDSDRTGLTRPFGDTAMFVPESDNEGQLAFVLPADTRTVRVLIRANNVAPLDLSTGGAAGPTWPTPLHTIADGSTMRLHVLPTPAPPPDLPPPAAGRAYQLIDLVAENLKPRSGVELQTVQLRLQAADGSFINPSPLSSSVPCRLPSDGLIPPSTSRRFTLVYDIPWDQPARRFEYRGFEVDAAGVDLP